MSLAVTNRIYEYATNCAIIWLNTNEKHNIVKAVEQSSTASKGFEGGHRDQRTETRVLSKGQNT
jgi:hypothetical protein